MLRSELQFNPNKCENNCTSLEHEGKLFPLYGSSWQSVSYPQASRTPPVLSCICLIKRWLNVPEDLPSNTLCTLACPLLSEYALISGTLKGTPVLWEWSQRDLMSR